MRIKILNKPVRQNVELFLQILRRVKQKQVQKSLPSQKVFVAWLNRETGQLLFAETAEESQFLQKREWKPISFSYRYDVISGEIEFFVQEADEKQQVFHSDDMAPSAFRILQETMKIFHEISQKLNGPSDFDTKISVLSKLSIDAEVSHIDRNILIDAWHHADRTQAESLLLDRPVGTYLFRKDPYAEVLEEQLERQLRKKINCFTLTYSQENRKISDCTLVHFEGIWEIYNDDPSLKQKKFPDLKDLVSSMKDVLRYPLYHQW
jgi:hypothetical protein